MLAVMARLAFLQEIGLLDLEVFLLQLVLLVPVQLALLVPVQLALLVPLGQLKESSHLRKQNY
jgi:hypothetical protein